MSLLTRYRINRHIVGNEVKISFAGIDMHGLGTVLAENEKIIVVKFPAGKHWSGRFMPAAYHSPSVYVLQKKADGWAYPLIDWEVKRAQKGSSE